MSSSRICRPGDAAEVEPIEWRVCGAAPGRTGRIDHAGAEAAAAHAAGREREIEAAAYRQAYQQGVAATEAAAREQAQARVEPVLAGLSGAIAELAGLRRKFRAEAEEDTVRLAIAMARRVLYRELACDPEALLGLVKAAFQKCNARETHRLRLSPQDAETVRENRERLNLPPAVEIAADGGLARGSAIFETSRGDLDASIDTQLGEIERGLTDVMKRRRQ
jgi:flagellar assembly protein FliH